MIIQPFEVKMAQKQESLFLVKLKTKYLLSFSTTIPTMSSSVKARRQTKTCKKQQTLLTKGNKVEVKSDEEGFRGAWYESSVVDSAMSRNRKKKRQVLVQYDTLLAADGVSLLTEYVCPTFIRPIPPKLDGNVRPCFEVFDVVDAFHLDGWWKGVVSSVREVDGVKKYMVVFETPPHQIEFSGEDLRAHWDWICEDWVKAPKEYRMKGLEFSKGMTVEVSLLKGRPKYVWFQAVILEEHGFNSFVVEFCGQGNSNENRKRAIFYSFHIRPPYPIFKSKEFELLDKVCVFHGLAREEGFITNISTDGSYVVYLKGGKVTKKFDKSKLMPYLQFVNGKWIGRRCKDGSLISSCQGQYDILVKDEERSPVVTFQLDCAISEKTRVVEKNPCRISCTNQLNYSTIFDSKFKKARSRARRRKTTITSPCQKFKGEKLAKRSSSGECHETSTPPTPLEQSNGGNSNSFMVAKCSSNPVAEKNLSVESTIPDSTKETHGEEAAVEDNMMTFTEKREAPQNLELEVQRFSTSGGEDNGKRVLGKTLVPQSSTDCMEKEVNMDASLVDNKRRKIDVDIQLEIASDLNNQVQEKIPCTNLCENSSNYSASLNAELMNAKHSACKSKAESPSPCKKFRGESYVTCSSSVESHEQSTPIEKFNGENITCCMLPKYSSNHAVDKFPSVESTSFINSGTNKEARMEVDMMTSVHKSGVPENSGLKSQQISASGGGENSAEYHPQELGSDGEKDNRKYVSEEMLTPQFSADFIAGVDVFYVGPNRRGKSGGLLVNDHYQFLRSEGGNSFGKIKSVETSTPFSATDSWRKEADIVNIATDSVENCVGTAHQPPFSEGHSHCNIQDQCNDTIDGQSVPGVASSVEVNNEPVENAEMPFVKNPHLWSFVDSLEIFERMPQNPHFRPLMNFREAFREGFALGYMMTFSTVAEKISELQVTDSQNKFDSFLETFAELETHGFKVKPLVDRVNSLLLTRREHKQLEDQSKEVKSQLADRTSEQVRLNCCILSIDKVLSELEKERGLYVLLEKNTRRDITNLRRDDNSILEGISAAMREFESLVTAPW